MLIDHFLTFSDAQAFSTDAISTNIVDLIKTGRRLGSGEPMAIVLFVDVAADGTTTDETYEFQIRTDDDVAFGSPTTLDTKAVAYASLTAGARVVLPISPDWTFERYLGVYFNGGGTSPTITATIALMPMSTIRKFKDYGNNYTITH